MSLGNVHLTPQLVQAVRDAVDIVAVASEHTRLRKAGRSYQGLCPIHKEKTPSFSVDPAKGLFYCFGCGAGGDAIKLHMLLTGDDFPAAIETLAGRYGIPLPSRVEARPGFKPERDLEGALKAAAEYFVDQLARSALAREYLDRRQIPQALIERFELGYALDGFHNLVPALGSRIAQGDLEAAGLVGRSERGDLYDRFRHRLMFPIRNAAGRLVGFGGRTLGDDKAKYINTSETDRFRKGELLFGLHLAKREMRESGRAILVEGYFDVIATVACGLEAAVAGMGTALTPEQVRLLARYADEVVVGYDGDSAGEAAFRRALPLLLGERLRVSKARFPGDHDPDSLRLEQGQEAVRKAVEAAEDAVTMELSRILPPGSKGLGGLTREQADGITGLIQLVRDPLEQDFYLRRASDVIGVSKKILASQLKNLARWEDAVGRPVKEAGSPVRSVEEQVLEQLLRDEGGGSLPPVADLPPPEVFFDAECRNIYQAFRALYARSGGAPPDARQVGAELGLQAGLVDRMARILLEGNFVSGRSGLLESLDNLRDRWQRRRLQELQQEINEAQRAGDRALLHRLVEERTRLSQSLHRGARAPQGGRLG